MPPSFGEELTTIDGHNPGEIERAVTAFAREPNGGLIVTASPSAVTHRDLIISVATRCRLPNVYAYRYYPTNGRSMSTSARPFTSIASSRGEKPAELPVQVPTRYVLVINIKTAKALGITAGDGARTRRRGY